jgi:hypothetical protein
LHHMRPALRPSTDLATNSTLVHAVFSNVPTVRFERKWTKPRASSRPRPSHKRRRETQGRGHAQPCPTCRTRHGRRCGPQPRRARPACQTG